MAVPAALKTCAMRSKKRLAQILLWTVISVYTFLLPNAVIIYRKLVTYIGEEAVGKVPLIVVMIIGLVYGVIGFVKNKNFRHILFLIPSAMIALAIIQFEPNPNKHIHIPEYVLMAWLLYLVLSQDYQGKGLMILVFVCGSLLGVVDELEQGIHPRRFYGWSDMAVNASSVLIGILTIQGLVKERGSGWNWAKRLSALRHTLWPYGLIFLGALFTCIQLFKVQVTETFWGSYPPWLLVWNYCAVVLGIILLISQLKPFSQGNEGLPDDEIHEWSTARKWIFPPLSILIYIHALSIFVSISGVNFR